MKDDAERAARDDAARKSLDAAESAIADALRVVRHAIADARSTAMAAGAHASLEGHGGHLADRTARQLTDLRAQEASLAEQLASLRRQRAMLDDRAAAARIAATDARLTLDAERAANLDSEATEDGR